MAYKIDVFGNTGFDSVNIPCAPDLLYEDEFSGCLLRQYEDMWILQDEVGQYIQVEEENAEEILACDYVIVYDEDYGPSEDWLKKATCFIVKSAQMIAPNTCRVYLLKDPYNTMGGFDHRYNHNNIVIAGSVQRISVPMIKYTDRNGHTEDDAGYEHYKAIWPQRENDDFFTLEEPFQPSQKCVMNYQPFTPGPGPVPPGPTPTPEDYVNFRYPVKNIGTSTNGWRRPSVGTYAGQFCVLGEAGYNMSTYTSGSPPVYQYCDLDSGGNNVRQVFAGKAEFVEAFTNDIIAGISRLASDVPASNPKFANDLINIIAPAIVTITDQFKVGAPTSDNEFTVQITPHWVNASGQSFYIHQYREDRTPKVVINADAEQINPFSQSNGIYYYLNMKLPCCGRFKYAVCEDGRIQQVG